MDHQELLNEIKQAIHHRFDQLDLRISLHNDKLDDYVQRITRVESAYEHLQARVKWIYGILSGVALAAFTWLGSKITGA